ncbi:MAG TPA: methyltransferase domain-containing protein [Thermohalobaculum sp.]|nr:methyltransferase domain-containing protein [Thermohalobaculum sp.]
MRPRNHRRVFLGQMLRRPGRTGAVSPSSKALARTMTREMSPETGAVVELGGGTGKITEAILASGVPAERLAVFETNPLFADLLRERFPGVQVLTLDARRVAEVPLTDVGAVVSGLPMLAIPGGDQHTILEGAFRLMRPGGVFIQFTYGWRTPIERKVYETLELEWTKSRWVLGNLPPARVYWFRQAAPKSVL